jgi:hypothetical protein
MVRKSATINHLVLIFFLVPLGIHAATGLQQLQTYDSGGYKTSAVAVADLNGDGRPDLAAVNVCGSADCSNRGGSLSVLLGNGDGTFQAARNDAFDFAFSPSIAIADLNGDSKLDLVVASNSIAGGIGVLLGNGDGTFQTTITTYGSGGNTAQSVAVADVNLDGKPDVVVGNFCALDVCGGHGVVGVLLGNGDGTFQTAQTYDSGAFEGGPFGGTPISIAIADVNRDGILDLLAGNAGCTSVAACQQGSVAVLLGNGDGTFQTASLYDSGGWGLSSMAVGNLDQVFDRKPDIVVTNLCLSSADCGMGNVGKLFGNGNGTFQPAQTITENPPDAIALADLNGNGKNDLATANNLPGVLMGSIKVLSGRGDGNFRDAESSRSGGDFAFAIAVSDLNGDGKNDLVIANGWKQYRQQTTGNIAVILSK